ncbi:MAG: Uma2 family endonuclease [Planctomycetaceae bacterium]|nr:Uma2 family endonuclease [Planctomycetaceae bacterium]
MSIAELSTIHRLNPEDNGLCLTPVEFDAVEDWDRDYTFELVQGVVIVSPAPGVGERKPNDVLGHWLQTYQESHPDGTCIDDTLPEQYIAVDNGRRRADRAIWVGLGRDPDVERDVPQIAIEFVSERRRDRHRDYVLKRQEYREAGVVEYWVIDRFERSVTVYGADTENKFNENQSVHSALLPGFELSVEQLMKAIDRYQPSSHK